MNTKQDAILNVKGLTRYIDDLPEPEDCLQAAVRLSESARGRLGLMDTSKALALDPSVIVITGKDVPGENQVGANKPDEPLLPVDEWDYWGQPLALVLASTRAIARRAAALITIGGDPLPFVTDPRQSVAAGDFILPSRTIQSGDPDKAFEKCAFVVSGRVDSGGQEHVYLETQGAYAELRDSSRIFVVSSTQGPTGVQRAVAKVLGLPMNHVEVEARRLGGGFGGKEDQAATWGSLAALGAWISGKPVKLYLNRKDDMRATGKRHPYTSDFKLGADANGRLVAFEAVYYQNSGASCDLSPAILSRTLLHATGTYRVPNVRVTGHMAHTNLPSFTAFRGFGAPQGFFVIESALDALSRAIGRPRIDIQRLNVFLEGDVTHYGMPLSNVRAGEAFSVLEGKLRAKGVETEIARFNASHSLEKMGMAILPLCFGISFTKLSMNQAGALVHVYTDGSVLVSTGAIEMGQQVARKIALVVSRSLGVSLRRIRVERTTTLTVANTVPTAASTGSDLNGMAAMVACGQIKQRLAKVAAGILAAERGMAGIEAEDIDFRDGIVLVSGGDSGLRWEKLIQAAHDARVDLSAHGFYSTPGLFYDMATEKGSPFAYHVYGAACIVAKVDLLRAKSSLTAAYIVHDSGTSLDPEVDLGQIEGALAQGLGWTLLEDLRFGADGRPLSDTLSTYKLPDADFMPPLVEVDILPARENPAAPFNSKAVGEPPLQYGIAAYFAILEAIRAAKPDAAARYDLPFIPEKIEAMLSGRDPC